MIEFVFLLVGFLFLLNVWRRTSALEREVQNLKEDLRNIRQNVAKVVTAAAVARPTADGQPSPVPPGTSDFLATSDLHIPDAPEAAPAANPYSDWKPADRPWATTETPASTAAQTAHIPSEDAVWDDELERAPGKKTVGSGAGGALPPKSVVPARDNFEFNFGKKLPVWIGGIALAFAGFYLVKYAIDQKWLTEGVRVVLGFIFGIGMIGAGAYIRAKKPGMADGTRIAQALTGAGIADLYATIFAATTMFHMLYPPAGFLCMAIVTAMAVILSVRHGMPIAILGLLGGFLTPVLIHTGHPNAAMLFSYLFLLVVGFFVTIATLAWWVLAIPVLLLAFLWVPVWLVTGYFHPDDGIVLCLFLLACSAVALVSAGKSEKSSSPMNVEWGKNLGYIAIGGAIVLMAIVTGFANFALEDMGLYALLGAGCLAIAWFRPKEYAAAPWLSMIASLLMLAVWNHPDNSEYAWVLLGFAALYNVGPLFLLQSRPTVKAAGLLSASALSFYGLGWVRLSEKLYDLLGIAKTETLHLWGILAIALGGVFTLLTAQFMHRLKDSADELRQQVLAILVLTATAFLSVALTIEVRHEFLAVAFAAEILAVCWVNLKVDIKALRQVAGILFGVFIALMGEQLLVLFAVVINSLFGHQLDFWHGQFPLAEDPIFHVGLPMALIGLSSYLIQRHHDGKLAEVFEMATVGLGALLLYYVMRNIFRADPTVMFPPVSFFQRGVTTNLFFAAGLAVVYAGRQFSRRALVWSGTAVFAMAMFRVIWFDFLTQNPLFTGKEVGDVFLFNSLIFPYLLPCFWLWLEDRPQMRLVTMSPIARGGMMLTLLFTFITLNVRESFHGSVLTGTATNAEVYAYSVVWLMLGGFMLFFGQARRNTPMRRASLALIVLTILKVFLYDASELGGLYRVFSFMGLGLSLLALSWFYSRFVFKDEEKTQ